MKMRRAPGVPVGLMADQAYLLNWDLVVVESPFAPQTPAIARDCYWGYESSCKRQDLLCSSCEAFESVQAKRRDEYAHNERYLAAAMADCLNRGESPYASHRVLTMPGVLNDEVPEQRQAGIMAGFAWRRAATRTVVYTDLGISRGMRAGLDDAWMFNHPIEFRSLPAWAPSKHPAECYLFHGACVYECGQRVSS